MPISFVAAGAVATGTNPVVSVPAGVQEQDFLVLTVSVAAAVAPTTPGGWTLVGSTTTTPRIYIYRKFAGPTESSVTLSVASTTTTAAMLAYRGVSATDTVSTFANVTSTTIATGTLTTTHANEFVVSVYAMTTGAATWTAPGSTTQRINAAGTAALSGILVVDELQVAAGVSAARTATSSVSKALSAGSFSIIPSGRYWVGGTNNWDGTAGTKWSFTSGGSGGAPVPLSTDDVFFDSASGSVTVTIAAGNTGAKSINCTGFTGTIAGSAALTVSGSITFVTAMTVTYTGFVTIVGNATITSAGKNFQRLFISGSGITVNQADALTITDQLEITFGTFNTNNYSLTCSGLFSTGTLVRRLNLGSSTVTATASGPVTIFSGTGFTFDAGTSTIQASNTAANLSNTGSFTFYNVSFTWNQSGNRTISGINTFNNLSITAPNSPGVVQVTFSNPQTINGTLSTTNTAGNRRVIFQSITYGLAQTITINSTPSLTDCDFRDIYVIGTAAPISGTRIGDLRGCRGITFSTPKTVYWNLAGAQNWSANGWSDTSTGTPNTDFFPLAQDTATFTNSGSVTGTITMDSAIPYTGTVDMSSRTTSMTLSTSVQTIYGDWKNGSGTTLSITTGLGFSGRNTQTITSAGKNFGANIYIDTYGGTVQLADAISITSGSGREIVVTNGTFDTKNYNVTCAILSSNNSNIRTINLGSSTVSLSPISTYNLISLNSTNLTFNAGTSTITFGGFLGGQTYTFNGAGLTFYNVTFDFFAATATSFLTISDNNTFNNLTLIRNTVLGQRITKCTFNNNQTINGTFSITGNIDATYRGQIFSGTPGTQITLTVNTLSAPDCDFCDIAIQGAAANTSQTRIGDLGNNSGISFTTPKTVYWNLAGSQSWYSTGWATTSTGTPAVNNFPLPQDTAIFTDSGAAGTISIVYAHYIGNIDMSARTTAMTLDISTSGNGLFIVGDLKLGTGTTISSSLLSRPLIFCNRVTKTITSNGKTIDALLRVFCYSGTVQLADAFSTSVGIEPISGTFDAVSYNVTTPYLDAVSPTSGVPTATGTIKMGSGTWTLTGTLNGRAWRPLPNSAFYKGTADILLSNNTTNSRTFEGGGLSYNKLTIGGTTSTSTTTITGNNQFTELASTKTVAHTINFGNTSQTFGKWTVTGTVGNVVTLSGTGTTHVLAGSCTSGIDYLAMGSIGFVVNGPAEFYAGANSTGTATAPVYRTAKPADSTRYWVGGTGNWSDTNRWSTDSGGTGGASIPRSHDDVVFNSASSATSYTVTVDAVTGSIRMKSLTITGPASGNVTLAGSVGFLGVHGNITLPATGLTRTYTGQIVLTGSTTGKTITTNGVTLASAIVVNGVDCGWSLGSALNMGSNTLTITNGTFDLATYNLTAGSVVSDNGNSRTINFGSGTTSLDLGTSVNFGTTETNRANLTVTAGTSQINITTTNPTFSGNNKTFYNVSFTSISAGTITINGTNSFNNLSFGGVTGGAGLKTVPLTSNQTVTGTLTFSPGTDATMRHFCRSDTIGTPRTITAAAVSLTDVDFRDIVIAGAAAPASGTRIGDCKGNSGITFTAAKTVYWNLAGNQNWSATGWATQSNGTPNINNFPLAQDTCVFDNFGSFTGTITTNQAYNIGTIDALGKTSGSGAQISLGNTPTLYGDLKISSNVALPFSPTFTVAGTGTQTITISGQTLGSITVSKPSGTIELGSAITLSTLTLNIGSIDTKSYNVTAINFSSTGSNTRSLNIGSGTWTLSSTTPWSHTGSNLTVTGTGTIKLTSASAKTFAGGSVAYTNITLDQGGAGTLTVTGNNTFKDITNSYKTTGAATISLGNTTQRLSQFTGSGESGRALTITGTSATSPANLVLSSGTVSQDYLTITGIMAYPLSNTWYGGTNSTNNGSLGWIFESLPLSTGNFFLVF